MILADTSIWVNHFRKKEPTLQELLLQGSVLIHSFVIAELALGHLPHREEMLKLLSTLPKATEIRQDEFLTFIHRHRLEGSGLGMVDVHLLASAMLSKATLWTGDNKLKQAALRLDLLPRNS